MIELSDVSKSFVLHNQGDAVIPVMAGAALSVAPGECVALVGNSGAGKSTLMRMIYGNYLAGGGAIRVGDVDVARAEPREILRVPALDVVAEPVLAAGGSHAEAEARARDLLARLNVPERLWTLSPTTFSGGEQQRVNIARGFAHLFPAMLLDEPTASLDATNRAVVLALIAEAKARGAAIVGIFHDAEARAQVCDREVDVSGFAPERAA
jgi:alpha-D-ribose 1-methylphosphonate 5-triphosphate synthase subunit PhnL